ncbi:MAG: hypothetical protein EAZ97_08085 [Bacteroidetes bacterium]|nr:MAG: hypothetical protein EAZ97_08085 [Bacteroidota bacterium]
MFANANAQKLYPKGKFLADQVKVGEQIKYVLTLEHSADVEVLFPDSTYNFAPFELIEKRYFPTITNGLSRDSAVYILQTFELDSLQQLALPIFVLNGGDTSMIRSDFSQVLLKEITMNVPISEEVKTLENTEYLATKQELNYPIIILIGVILIVVLILIFVIFGGRIRKSFRLQRLKRQYERFANDYKRQISNNPDVKKIEKGLYLWKNYLEDLQKIPFTSYTSREISTIIADEKLLTSLKNIDVAIYGNLYNEQTENAFIVLQTHAFEAYQYKLEEVRNG